MGFLASLRKLFATGAPKLKPEAFRQCYNELKSRGAQLLDVRTPKEYEAGHLSNAKPNNLLERGFQDRLLALNPDKPVFIYCRSGRRSAMAARLLKEHGFTELYDLKGGILAYEAHFGNHKL